MPVPTWAVGQVLTASDVNTWFVPLAAVKPADTSRAGTITALASDPDLTLPVAANATYRFDAYLDYEGGTGGSADLAIGWTGPSGTTFRYQLVATGSAGSTTEGNTYTAVSTPAIRTQGAGVLCGATVTGTLLTTGAGTYAFQWATNTSNGTATIVHGTSWLCLTRLG